MTSFKICPGVSFSPPLLVWSSVSLSSLFSQTSLMVLLLFQPPLPDWAARAILGAPEQGEAVGLPESSVPLQLPHRCGFSPKLVLHTGFCFVLSCPSLLPPNLIQIHISGPLPQIFKSEPRNRMIHVEGRKIFTLPNAQVYESTSFKSTQGLPYHIYLLCILPACHLH